jgi:hypothetical protein
MPIAVLVFAWRIIERGKKAGERSNLTREPHARKLESFADLVRSSREFCVVNEGDRAEPGALH